MVTLAWFVCAIAPVFTLEIDKLKNSHIRPPKEDKRGVSIAPIFPVFPLLAWGLAALLDWTGPKWGSAAIVWLHVALLAFLIVGIVPYLFKIRALQRQLAKRDTEK